MIRVCQHVINRDAAETCRKCQASSCRLLFGGHSEVLPSQSVEWRCRPATGIHLNRAGCVYTEHIRARWQSPSLLPGKICGDKIHVSKLAHSFIMQRRRTWQFVYTSTPRDPFCVFQAATAAGSSSMRGISSRDALCILVWRCCRRTLLLCDAWFCPSQPSTNETRLRNRPSTGRIKWRREPTRPPAAI